MIIETRGDLLTTYCADYICHQTNYFGVMGGGVALAIRDKLLSDNAYKAYQMLCDQKGRDLLGKVQFLSCVFDKERYPHGHVCTVANLFCQDEYVQPDGGITRYDCMRKCLQSVEQQALQSKRGKVVVIPGGIGCGIAGGQWSTVRGIIEEVFGHSRVICMIVWKE